MRTQCPPADWLWAPESRLPASNFPVHKRTCFVYDSNLDVRVCITRIFEFKEGGWMKVLVDLCVVPLGVGVSVSSYIAACEKVLTEAGLKTALHSYGTNIEGEWDEVFAAIKRCHEVVHEMGAPRITTTVKLGTRTDRNQTMEDKIRSVKEKM